MTGRGLALGLVGALGALAGCPSGDAPLDGGGEVRLDGGGSSAPFTVELGTGRTAFRPVAGDDTLYMENGLQGLQHVLVSLRVVGLDEGRYLTDFALTRDDGLVVSYPAQVRLPFALADDGVELLGYQLVVREPDAIAGFSGRVRASVEGAGGEVDADERAVQVEWAPEGWDPDEG